MEGRACEAARLPDLPNACFRLCTWVSIGNTHLFFSQRVKAHTNVYQLLHKGFCILFYLCIYTFIYSAALGLRCCTRTFSSSGEQGLLFVAVRELLIAVASLVAEHGL